MSVTVNDVDKSGDTIVVVPNKTPVALGCHLGGRLYRGDQKIFSQVSP